MTQNYLIIIGLLSNLKKKEITSTVSNYQLRYPTFTNDVGVVCRQIVNHCMENPTFKGIFHWQSNECLTKFQMIQVMSKVFNIPMNHIQPEDGPGSSTTPRPYHCQLDCSDLEKLGIGRRSSFEETIKKVLQKFV